MKKKGRTKEESKGPRRAPEREEKNKWGKAIYLILVIIIADT
jgi:hypothetical protein